MQYVDDPLTKSVLFPSDLLHMGEKLSELKEHYIDCFEGEATEEAKAQLQIALSMMASAAGMLKLAGINPYPTK